MSLYTLTVDLLARTGSFERDLGKAARIADRDAQRIEAAASRAGIAIGAAVAAAVTGITYMVQRNVALMDSTSKMAGQIGVAVDQLTSLRYAAQQMANVSDGQFDMALRRMTRRIAEAADDGGRVATMLERIGLSAKELARLSPDEQFRRVAEAIRATNDQGTRLRATMALMDTEGMPLVNMLQQGAVAIGEMGEQARRLGLTFDSQTAKAAEEFASTMTRARAAVSGFAMQVAGELLPTLNDVVGSLEGVTNEGEAARRVAVGIGTSFELAAGGVKVFADYFPQVAAAVGTFTSIKVMQAINRRILAVVMGIKADRDAAAAAVASARATLAKAEAAVVEAGMNLRAANTNRQRILAERALTAAVNDQTAARARLTAAETAAARASAGLLARTGSATLALFGGPIGLGAVVAATAASWIMFRDNTKDADSALADWNGTAEQAIQKARELNQQQLAGAILRVSEEIEETLDGVGGAIDRLAAKFQQLDPAAGGQLRELAEQFREGTLTADEFAQKIDELNRDVLERTGLSGNRGTVAEVTRLTSGLADAAREADRKREIMSGLSDVQRETATATAGTTGAIREQTEQMEAAAAAATEWGNKISKALTDLPGQIERVGKSAREIAQLDVRDWIAAETLSQGITSVDDPRFKALQEQGQRYIDLQTQLAAAQDATRTKTSTDASRAMERQTESLARYNREAEMAAATLSGPLQAAEVAHRHRLADLDAELKKGNISQAAYNTLKAESADQLERTTRALEAQMRAPEQLLGAMREEMELLGMVGPARELYRRGLQNEREMREAINRATEAGAVFSDEMTESLVRQARAMAGMTVEVEEAARAAEDWRWAMMGPIEGVADMFTNLFTGQIKSTKDFFTELKDIWKRGWWDIVRMSMQQSFVNPIQRAIAGMMSGQGFAGAGAGPANLAQGFAGTLLMGGGATVIGAGTAHGGAAVPGWGYGGAGVAGMGAPGAYGSGGFGMPGMVPSKSLLTGEFAGGMPYASAALGVLGAYYGLTQRGNNALVSGVAGLSYGALGVAAGGAIAGGLGALGTSAGIAGAGAGAVAGSQAAMGSAAGLVGSAGWIPIVGWALAAVAVVDIISGGRLFGTKYKPQSITQELGIDASGGTASASVHETRKRSLFRGTARRDRDIDVSPEQRQAAQDLFDAMEQVARTASRQLGVATAKIVSGSIEQVFNRDGELQSELSRVLGRTYEETFEEFASRLASEQMIAAVAQVDSAASRIAEQWRRSSEMLAEGAEFFMTAASDARNGMDIWTGIGLQALTDFVQGMQMADESLARTYARVAETAGSYGQLITDVNTQLMADGLNDYQRQALEVERTYRQQVKAANEYAKALGLTGARAEDLAKIEELRAVNLGKLQAQMEADNAAFLGQLTLSDLSPLRDDQKLQEAMRQFGDAVSAGNTQAAQQAAQAALGLGRNLYASGRDYQNLYDQITGALAGMVPDRDDLDMGDMADEIEAMHEGISRAIFELAAQGEHTITAPIRAEQQRTNELLGEVLDELRRQGHNTGTARLREELNGRQAVMVR